MILYKYSRGREFYMLNFNSIFDYIFLIFIGLNVGILRGRKKNF